MQNPIVESLPCYTNFIRLVVERITPNCTKVERSWTQLVDLKDEGMCLANLLTSRPASHIELLLTK